MSQGFGKLFLSVLDQDACVDVVYRAAFTDQHRSWHHIQILEPGTLTSLVVGVVTLGDLIIPY